VPSGNGRNAWNSQGSVCYGMYVCGTQDGDLVVLWAGEAGVDLHGAFELLRVDRIRSEITLG
jgi:hypothetical protein